MNHYTYLLQSQTSTGFDTTGVIPWNKGIKMSDEARINMSNAVKGRVWINNGEINKQVTPDKIPEGFIRGRIYKRKA